MPLLKDFAIPSHMGRQACRLYRGRQCLQSQTRHFSRSKDTSARVSGAAEAEIQAAHRYCTGLLAKYDRPSYTLNAFIPRPAQPMYLALRALNVSLSMIPDTTSSYTIGLMRLQFWRDTITKVLSDTPPKEPVAVLLAWQSQTFITEPRTLTNDPYPNIAALESYAENTYSTLMYLTLSALPMASVTADHVASHIGKAAGIAAVLRGLPLVAFPPPAARSPSDGALSPGAAGGGGAKQGAVMLPLDIMAQTGVKEEDVFRKGAEADGLRDAVFAVATRASDHLITVQQMLTNLRAGQDVGHDFEHEGEEGHEYAAAGQKGEAPLDEVNRAFGVFMPAVGTRLWLDRLQEVDFDIFRPELLRSDWKLPWKAYWAFRRKSF
ncbi:hypothetical protein PHISCL_02952 [Aspergillus sclerotialis]|uniref:Squalene phytoene synthase n=1 Tax=Aspergillus sclerotialis TaxID=2070753 RepID=A0A3A2ZTG3_9EURO|nr:hypothetical protein PHISCL_02952 [Aspergillus sclerotialis]